jgi:hypothetical protein
VFTRPRLGTCGGTFTDVACRLETSCSASRPVIWHCWPERGGTLRRYCPGHTLILSKRHLRSVSGVTSWLTGNVTTHGNPAARLP